jgi:hypothetical protein
VALGQAVDPGRGHTAAISGSSHQYPRARRPCTFNASEDTRRRLGIDAWTQIGSRIALGSLAKSTCQVYEPLSQFIGYGSLDDDPLGVHAILAGRPKGSGTDRSGGVNQICVSGDYDDTDTAKLQDKALKSRLPNDAPARRAPSSE